jgi:ethanolamine utilization protein EutQ
MKKLISALVVKEAHKDGIKEIGAPPGTTIVTPEARSIAEKLGVKILDMDKNCGSPADKNVDQKTIGLIIEMVRAKLPEGKYSEDDIKKAVIEVLSNS